MYLICESVGEFIIVKVYLLQNVSFLLEYSVNVNIKWQSGIRDLVPNSKVYIIGMDTSILSLAAILVDASTRVVRLHQLDLFNLHLV